MSPCQGTAGRTFTPEATLATFDGRHYSRIEVHTEQRPLLAERVKAFADQLRAYGIPRPIAPASGDRAADFAFRPDSYTGGVRK